MVSFVSFVVVALASVAAAKSSASKGPSDASILQYALTLEHLEAEFYKQAKAKFTADDYAAAGYADGQGIADRTSELAADEAAHVKFLTAGLTAAGAKPVPACTYNFNASLSSVDSYLATSRVLEGVGVSAYLGAAADITTKAYLTAAGAILTVEARHQAVISEINQESGISSPFDTPLNYNEVFSLAAPFIKKCPDGVLSQLPATMAYKNLEVRPPQPSSGSTIRVRLPPSGPSNLHLIVLNGLETTSLKVNHYGQARLPKGLSGTIYLILSKTATYDPKEVISFGLFQLASGVDPIVTKATTKRRMH